MKNTSDLCKQIPLPEENCHVHHNADFRVRPTIKVLQHPPPREPTNYLIVEFKLAYSLLASNGQWGTTGQDYPWGWPIVFVHLGGDVIRSQCYFQHSLKWVSPQRYGMFPVEAVFNGDPQIWICIILLVIWLKRNAGKI